MRQQSCSLSLGKGGQLQRAPPPQQWPTHATQCTTGSRACQAESAATLRYLTTILPVTITVVIRNMQQAAVPGPARGVGTVRQLRISQIEQAFAHCGVQFFLGGGQALYLNEMAGVWRAKCLHKSARNESSKMPVQTATWMPLNLHSSCHKVHSPCEGGAHTYFITAPPLIALRQWYSVASPQ